MLKFDIKLLCLSPPQIDHGAFVAIGRQGQTPRLHNTINNITRSQINITVHYSHKQHKHEN